MVIVNSAQREAHCTICRVQQYSAGTVAYTVHTAQYTMPAQAHHVVRQYRAEQSSTEQYTVHTAQYSTVCSIGQARHGGLRSEESGSYDAPVAIVHGSDGGARHAKVENVILFDIDKRHEGNAIPVAVGLALEKRREKERKDQAS